MDRGTRKGKKVGRKRLREALGKMLLGFMKPSVSEVMSTGG